jgi:hypothetical protein
MKQNIKGNREKYKKQEREYEGLLDDHKSKKEIENEIVEIDDGEKSQIVQS